jgi:hypothetical protein
MMYQNMAGDRMRTLLDYEQQISSVVTEKGSDVALSKHVGPLFIVSPLLFLILAPNKATRCQDIDFRPLT